MKPLKKPNRILVFVIVLPLFFIAGSLLYLPYVVAEVKNPVAALFNDKLSKIERPDFKKFQLTGKEISFMTEDSLRMSAYLIYGQQPVKGTVIALHGYRSNKNKYLSVARYFTQAGYHFAAIDLRGHNQSEGDFTGFSYYEKADVSAFISYLENNENIHPPFILYGHSIGAATALAVASENKKVSALVLESVFASFEDIIPNYIEFYTGIAIDSLPAHVEKPVFDFLKIPAGQIKPVAQAEKIEVPVLIIHGRDDCKVPIAQAERIYEVIQAPKSFIRIEGATHNTLWETGGADYFRRILSFLDKHLQQSHSSDFSL